MEKFYSNMATILEVDICTPQDILKGFDSWDSLAAISILAMAQGDYKSHISREDLDSVVTLGELEELIKSRANV